MAETAGQRIPDELIREIRETCSIVSVIGEYVALQKAGRNYKGLCPFHAEKTPSFHVNEERRFYHCFGCGESGDVFAFLMKREHMGFIEAVRAVARRVGIEVPDRAASPAQQRQREEREWLLTINQRAAQHYHRLLMEAPAGQPGRAYLERRGIGAEAIEAYGLGFAPDQWDTLAARVRTQSAAATRALQVGLLVKSDNGRLYDRFRNRVIFPIRNVAGQTIGFGGRLIAEGAPKYLNSPESPLYSKGSTLYGLPAAVRAMQQRRRVFVVEGYIDVLTLFQAGIANCVAALGTALTPRQINLLTRYQAEIVTVFDGDAAGKKAMARSLEAFLAAGVAPRVLVLPAGDDPDSFVRREGADAFGQLADSAGLLLDFVIEQTIAAHDIAAPRGRALACDALVPILRAIVDPLERGLYVRNLEQRLDVTSGLLQQRLGRTPAASGSAKAAEPPAEADAAERMIVTMMLAEPAVIAAVADAGLLDDFSDADLRRLGAAIIAMQRSRGSVDVSDLRAAIRDSRSQQLLSGCAFAEFDPETVTRILQDCARDVWLKKNARERKQVNLLLKQAEAASDDSACGEYRRRYQQLVDDHKAVRQRTLVLPHTDKEKRGWDASPK